jgi:D-aminoacyl-tRNA deacylase
MRALVQRVKNASVKVDEDIVGSIGPGLCVLVGVTHADSEASAAKLAEKLWHLRVFEDESGQMSLSASDTQRQILVVSQFTLYGDVSKGRRPSFVQAARPEQAEPLIDTLTTQLRTLGASVQTGRFRTHMEVALVNDGPVTLTLET